MTSEDCSGDEDGPERGGFLDRVLFLVDILATGIVPKATLRWGLAIGNATNGQILQDRPAI